MRIREIAIDAVRPGALARCATDTVMLDPEDNELRVHDPGGPPPGTPLWRYRLRMLWAFLTA